MNVDNWHPSPSYTLRFYSALEEPWYEETINSLWYHTRTLHGI